MELNSKKYEIDMCSGNLFIKIIRFSLPLMFMGMLQLLYNAADLVVVSNFSGDKDALGAVGSTSAIINLLVNLFIGLSVGTNVIVAKYFGAKKEDKISDVVHTSIFISLILGIFLGLFGFFFSRQLLHLMKNDLDLSVLYLKIYFLGMPFNLVYNFAASVLRAVGDTKRPLYFLAISGLANVLFNLVFVIFFDLSVAGVAIATVISQVISCVLIIRTLLKTNECYKLELNKLKISKDALLEIIKIGIPAGIQSIIFSISNVLIQSSINMFGPTVMNGNSAAQSVEGFVYVGLNSIYHASLAFMGQNVGAKNVKNIKKITIYSIIIVTLLSLLIGGTIFIFGKFVLKIYTKIPSEIDVGYIRLHYLCLPYFLCGIMDVMVGCLRGLGSSIIPMIVSIVGVCGFRVFWILTIFYSYTEFVNINDLHLLYVSYPISWILTFIVHLICYIFVSRKKIKSINLELALN